MHTLRSMTAVFGLTAGALFLGSGVSGIAPAGAASPPPRCQTAGLVVWMPIPGNGLFNSSVNGTTSPPVGGPAQTSFYQLQFTNLSGATCTLIGFPGVSAVDLGGHRIATPVRHAANQPKQVQLAQGSTAVAGLQIVGIRPFSPSACQHTTAAGLVVSPPGQTAAKTIPFPFCWLPGPVTFYVAAVQSPV